MSGEDLPGPWGRLDATSAAALEREVGSEVTPGHELHGLTLGAVAKCGGCDDAVFRASDGTFAIVHLTWSGTPEVDPWPLTTRLGGLVAVQAAMDQHEH